MIIIKYVKKHRFKRQERRPFKGSVSHMNNTIVGIDIGGSTTKIVGFDSSKKLIDPIFIRANDQITSVYGALGKFTTQNHIKLSDIERIMVTGVGSTFISNEIYNIPCRHVVEFPCIGMGGVYLSGLERAIVVSMGTGTAIVYADGDKSYEYLGGTGVGGGTLIGLSETILGVRTVENIIDLAKEGDLSHIDLRVNDITKNEIHPNLSPNLTAANFGKISDVATKGDLALGIINMIFETIGMTAIFAARSKNVKNIVLTGNMTTIPQAYDIFKSLNELFDINFIIPKNAQFGTVIGAALQ